MRRILLGLFALAFLLGGLVTLPIWGPEKHNYVAYLCIKVGLVLGAIWLAMPQVEDLLKKTPPWVWAVAGLSLLAAIFTKSFVIILPIIGIICFIQFVGWLFKPPGQNKQPRDQSGNSASRKK